MKKMIYVFLFTTAVLLIGLFVFQNSLLSRVENYYNGEAPEHYLENRQEDYIDVRLYAMGSVNYLNDYLYQYQFDNDQISFDFNVYHYETVLEEGPRFAIFFELFDVLIKDESITALNLTLSGNTSDEFVTQTVNINSINYRTNWFASAFIDYKDNETPYFNFSDLGKELGYIKEITITSNSNSELPLLVIKDNENANLNVGSDILVSGSETNEFTGNALKYDNLRSLYEEAENILQPKAINIENYNDIIVRNFVFYGVAVLVITFIFFVRKPLAESLERRKMRQKLQQKVD